MHIKAIKAQEGAKLEGIKLKHANGTSARAYRQLYDKILQLLEGSNAANELTEP